ncbi:MAG: DUF721 domain-containing protein [Bacteroidia bacterium]|nr:DUF721 domain-containing protein [Bacteroidia bacterium]
MSEHNEHSLKDSIKALLKAYHLDDGMREARVKEYWAENMGKVILKHTVELKLRNRVLHVYLNSSVVRQEIDMARSQVIRGLNEQLGEEWITGIQLH